MAIRISGETREVKTMRRTFLIVAGCLVILVFFILSANTRVKSEDVVKMTVKGVTVYPKTNSPVVILEAVEDKVELPIWIGFPEAQAIALRLENITTPRPMTHDLLMEALEKTGVKVLKIVISDLKDDIFYASIILDRDGKTIEIDSRPSDALALAVRVDAPVYATVSVLEKARGNKGLLYEAGEETRQRYGLSAQPLNQGLAEYFGLSKAEGILISDIVEKGVADEAGLKRGDIIFEVDGVRTAGLREFYDTLTVVENKKEFSVGVIREKDKLSLTFHSP